MRRALHLASLSAVIAASAASAAAADVIDVHPGNAAMHHALRQAHKGDELRIHSGTYPESFVVKKDVTLRGVGSSRPVIDGECNTRAPIEIRHAGVRLIGLRVQGANEGFGQFPSEVDFQSVASGRAKDLRTIDTCDAEYGVNAFDTGPVKILDNFGRGFSDSAIYVGAITDTLGGTLMVRGNRAVHNNRGAIVKDTVKAADVTLMQNVFDDNAASGFHADADSDHNYSRSNVAHGNGDEPFTDDNGNHNCGSANTFSLPRC